MIIGIKTTGIPPINTQENVLRRFAIVSPSLYVYIVGWTILCMEKLKWDIIIARTLLHYIKLTTVGHIDGSINT